MHLPAGFRVFDESPHYILGHVYEYGSILDKRSGQEIYIGDSHGDPTGGLIATHENWAFLYGHDSYLWTPMSITHLNPLFATTWDIFQWPFAARQLNEFVLAILEDPWGDNPGIYHYHIPTGTLQRIKDAPKPDGPYRDPDPTTFSW